MLSWVVLHKQFVGMRIIAVILSTTGISLLAYMDGIADNKTLAAVLIASGAAAGSAIYKVMFQKVMGAVSLGQAMMKRVNSQANFLILQVSLIISLIGILNMVVLWPVAMLLYLTGPGKVRYEKLCNILDDLETLEMTNLPWVSLCGSAIFSLGSQAVFVPLVRSAILGGNLLANYSVLITYEKFLTCGLVLAVPISSGHYHSMTGYYLTITSQLLKLRMESVSLG